MNEKTILIAEDEPANFKYLEAVIKDLGELKIVWAKNGREALDYVQKHPVDMIFMDMKMPEMDGITATTEIKKLQPEIPIVAQTAFAETYDVKRAKKAGCDDYVFKPISMKVVKEKVIQYLKLT